MTVNRNPDFFYRTNRFESITDSNRIDLNRESECSTQWSAYLRQGPTVPFKQTPDNISSVAGYDSALT